MEIRDLVASVSFHVDRKLFGAPPLAPLGFAQRLLAQARRRRNPAQAALFDGTRQYLAEAGQLTCRSGLLRLR
jgi:hypothetical protein